MTHPRKNAKWRVNTPPHDPGFYARFPRHFEDMNTEAERRTRWEHFSDWCATVLLIACALFLAFTVGLVIVTAYGAT